MRGRDKVKKSPALPAVLIVDEDLGFLGWLGELLTEAGYRTLPALNCRQAVSLIKKFKLTVDVIAVNEGLPGVSGMLSTLQRTHPPLKIVAIRNPAANHSKGIPAHATLERPSDGNRSPGRIGSRRSCVFSRRPRPKPPSSNSFWRSAPSAKR
jgi:hypothetical protein